MARVMPLRRMFRRRRMPGDLVFAIAFLLFAALMLAQLPSETKWLGGKALFAQPRFWPAVGVIGMSVFGLLHLIGSLASARQPGRWRELGLWAASLEYVAWFLAYVYLVPLGGYLPVTIVLAVLLTSRAGYRGWRWVGAAAGAALGIVVLFRTVLRVKVPAGALYEHLPDALRSFMMSYL